MVYKCLWDNIVTSGVPFDDFFEHFRLRPQHPLSEDIRVHAAEVFPGAQVFVCIQLRSLLRSTTFVPSLHTQIPVFYMT
jgi:hypothetical protein